MKDIALIYDQVFNVVGGGGVDYVFYVVVK